MNDIEKKKALEAEWNCSESVCDDCDGCFEDSKNEFIEQFIPELVKLDCPDCTKNILNIVFTEAYKTGYRDCLINQRDALDGVLEDIEFEE